MIVGYTTGIERLFLNMPTDNEISGRFYWQASELLGQHFDIFLKDEQQREQFMNVLMDTMLKCYALKYHKERYKAIEHDYLENVRTGSDGWYRSHDMLFELEAFLFQVKSSLDIGIKVISVLLPNRFKTSTFTDKGAKLIVGLEQYKKDQSAKQELVDELIHVLQDDREAWLKQAITLRDTLSHYRTFAEFNYKFVRRDGQESFVMPKVAGMEPVEYMALTYQNCIEFLQDFMCIAVGLFLPPTFWVGVRASNHPVSVGEPLAQYVKFCLDIHQDDTLTSSNT